MPIIESRAELGNKQLWGIWEISESCDELLGMLDNPDIHHELLSTYKSTARRLEYLAVRVLLKALLGREVLVKYRTNGSPYLSDMSYHISISHTRSYAAVILGAVPVGIDIEYRSSRVLKIPHRFLTDAEFDLLGASPSIEDLLLCWSAKETVFKLTGAHSFDYLRDVRILSGEFGCISGCMEVQELLTLAASVYRIRYDLFPAFVLTRFCGGL
jgi:phosphopantetheinyl transferase